MISCHENHFHLQTKNTSYWISISPYQHLLTLYYGPKTSDDANQSFLNHHQIETGTTIKYRREDSEYSLDHRCLEYSTQGQGDYRTTSLHLVMPDGSMVADLNVIGHTLLDDKPTISNLPSSRGNNTLILHLQDKLKVAVDLYYSVDYDSDVISKRVVVTNKSNQIITLNKVMSLQVDLLEHQMDALTLHGDWAKESHLQRSPLSIGTYSNQSRRGTSSNQHNPGLILAKPNTDQHQGEAYGFNLVYSGSHKSEVEINSHGYLRVLVGLNDDLFEWPLSSNQSFESPEAIMTYSNQGLNRLSQNFHQFVREQILPVHHQHPIIYNNWEATRFDFDHKKLIALAKVAKSFGIETFVLDDGWFGDRQSDNAGLGDYWINKKRLPKGLGTLIREINQIGLDFGLWVEPEMVNENSDLYRNHPEWVLKTPSRTPLTGRNQLVLNLCLPEVQDYIIENVSYLLDNHPITYIKWDMNRPQSDWYSDNLASQGMVPHSYMIGLYRVLDEIFKKRPQVTLEMCASGGNRFDLGMLCYASQIWSSDNTDPIERLKIQEGLTYFYPLSVISNHMAAAPNPSTLRYVPLSTRFNVAFFGSYGLELDITDLNHLERTVLKQQIERYKKYRNLIQNGIFSRLTTSQAYRYSWQLQDQERTILGLFQTLYQSSPLYDKIFPINLEAETIYQVRSLPQKVEIQQFGALMNHVLPFTIKKEGWFMKTVPNFYALDDAEELYRASGALLAKGLVLQQQFVSTGYTKDLRMLGDFGSTLYEITKEK